MRQIIVLIGTLAGLFAVGCNNARSGSQPSGRRDGGDSAAQLARAGGGPTVTQNLSDRLELVAAIAPQMPTGVTVSHTGRIFLCFPRWGDPVAFTVGELKNGRVSAYPDDAVNAGTLDDFNGKLVSVQSVVVDPADRLWALDTGSIHFGPVPAGAAKLICYDLATNQPIKTIVFPRDVCRAETYVNDVRFDLRRGKEGTAYITNSSDKEPNCLIVVDLATGHCRRRLDGDRSVMAETNFIPLVEGQPLMKRPPSGQPMPFKNGSDGIAISNDGRHIYYCPLAGEHLYRVSADALVDEKQTDEQVAKTVEDLGPRGFSSDGLESDAAGNIYLTDYTHNAVRRRDPSGAYSVLVSDPRLIWPDTLSVATDGYLYVTANQLDRGKDYHEGRDLRQPPYALFRIKIDAKPVMLK